MRVLEAARLPPSRRLHIPDVALFDSEVSYELDPATSVDPAAPRYSVTTRLVVREETIAGRRQLFKELWEAGDDLP